VDGSRVTEWQNQGINSNQLSQGGGNQSLDYCDDGDVDLWLKQQGKQEKGTQEIWRKVNPHELETYCLG
jgi:hypothetical protein